MKLPYTGLELKNLPEQGDICTLSEEESRIVVGGIQPQPLPPGITSTLVQPNNVLLRGIVIDSIVIGS